MKVAGLFAGIGGFELGFSRAKLETTLLCEIDAHARVVLEKNLPGVPIEADVEKLSDLPENLDVVCAGFPCQNLSNVGDRTGLDGNQSGLVNELFRLLTRRRVPWVIMENVPFMLHLKGGAAIRRILETLDELDYAWAYRVVDSRAFGLAQRRRRIFIVASREGDPRQILLSDDAGPIDWPRVDMSKPVGFYWSEGNTGVGLTGDAMPPLKTGSKWGIPTPPSALLPSGRVVTPTIEAAEQLQGFPVGWTEPVKQTRKPRYGWKLLGNAVSVPVAEWVATRLCDPKPYDGTKDKPFSEGKGLPGAAWSAAKGQWHRAGVSDAPVRKALVAISDMSPEDWPNISHRALAGFTMRARKSSLRFPEGFLDTLEKFQAEIAPNTD